MDLLELLGIWTRGFTSTAPPSPTWSGLLMGVLTERATIKRHSGSVNEAGESLRDSTTTVASDVPCRIVRMSGAELRRQNRVAVVGQYTCFLPYGVDVGEADQIIVGGTTYEIEFVSDDPGGAAHHTEVTVKEIR